MIGSYFLTTMYLFYVAKFERSIDKFVKEKCLTRKSMACFGGVHRRNVFTERETMKYEIMILLFMYTYNTTIVIFQFYCDEAYSHILFVVHNLFWFACIDIYNGVYIPLRHLQLNDLTIREYTLLTFYHYG